MVTSVCEKFIFGLHRNRDFLCANPSEVGGFSTEEAAIERGSEETSEKEPVQGIVFVCAVWIWLTVVDGLWGSILDAIS